MLKNMKKKILKISCLGLKKRKKKTMWSDLNKVSYKRDKDMLETQYPAFPELFVSQNMKIH